SEADNDYFGIERSSDGVNFKQIGKVAGTGNSYKLTDYSFVDYTPKSGQTNYYRLRQVDVTGSYAFSKICAVTFEGSQTISVFPNPVLNKFSVFGVAGNINKEHIALY